MYELLSFIAIVVVSRAAAPVLEHTHTHTHTHTFTHARCFVVHALLSIIGYRSVLQLFSLRGDGQLFSKSMNVTGIASLRGGKLGAALVKSGVRITAGGLKVRR